MVLKINVKFLKKPNVAFKRTEEVYDKTRCKSVGAWWTPITANANGSHEIVMPLKILGCILI